MGESHMRATLAVPKKACDRDGVRCRRKANIAGAECAAILRRHVNAGGMTMSVKQHPLATLNIDLVITHLTIT